MNEINNIIFKVLSNKATVEEKKLFDAWLNSSPTNFSEFVKLKSYWELEDTFVSTIDADDAFERFVKSKLKIKNDKKRHRLLISFITTAAAVALLLFMVNWPITSPVESFSFVTHDSRDTLCLPDSSVVVLNRNSRLSYSSEYNKTERRVKLTGEGYFAVQKNPNSPFVVDLVKSQITVLGTVFNISAYESNKSIKATLISGSIQYNMNDNQIVLKPNQELKYNKETEEISIKKVDITNSLLWLKDVYRYESAPLHVLLTDLGTIYNKQIDITDPELGKTIISGSFHNKESLTEILNIISRSVSIKWQINKDTILISHY